MIMFHTATDCAVMTFNANVSHLYSAFWAKDFDFVKYGRQGVYLANVR